MKNTLYQGILVVNCDVLDVVDAINSCDTDDFDVGSDLFSQYKISFILNNFDAILRNLDIISF
jgi:hypothetical protein